MKTNYDLDSSYTKKRLFEILKTNSLDEYDLLSRLRYSKVNNVYREWIKQVDDKEYNMICSKMAWQEEKYKYFINEIKYLSKIAEDKHLTLLFLKGFILADDLFYPTSIRNSDDMDLFIDYSEVHVMDSLLRESGYFVLNEDIYTNTLECITNFVSIRNELTHLAQYHKIIKTSNGEEFQIDIDLHIHCFHYMPEIKKDDPNSFFSRAVKKDIKRIGRSVLTLENHDTLIHLFAHFVRHFYWECFRYFRGREKHFQLRQDLLLEIGLFIEKHIDSIKYEILLQRSIFYNQLEPTYLSLIIISYLYPNLIEQGKLDMFEEYYLTHKFNNGISSRFINAVISINMEKLVYLEGGLLANCILSSMIKRLPITNIYHDRIDNLKKITLDRNYYNKNLVTISDEIVECTIKRDCKVGNLFINWNEQKLIIKMEIPKNKYVNVDSLECVETTISKDLEVSLIDERSILQGKSFNLNTISYKFDLTDRNNMKVFIGEDLIFYGKEKIFCITSSNQYTCINIEFFWKDLKLRPFSRRILGIQIASYFKIENNEVQYIKYSNDCKSNYNYDIFYPWPCELQRFRLID